MPLGEAGALEQPRACSRAPGLSAVFVSRSDVSANLEVRAGRVDYHTSRVREAKVRPFGPPSHIVSQPADVYDDLIRVEVTSRGTRPGTVNGRPKSRWLPCSTPAGRTWGSP